MQHLTQKAIYQKLSKRNKRMKNHQLKIIIDSKIITCHRINCLQSHNTSLKNKFLIFFRE